MKLTDYLVDPADLDWAELLRPWEHRLPWEATVWLVNRYGEPFLVDGDGAVHHFQPEGDTVELVAESQDAFWDLFEQGDRANQWLMIPLVETALRAGMTLGSGQCYGLAKPAVLGGDYTVENTRVKDLQEYYPFLAALHAQIRDLPDGAQVRIELED